MKKSIFFVIAIILISFSILSYKVYTLSEQKKLLENKAVVNTLLPSTATPVPTQTFVKKPDNNQIKPTNQPVKTQTVSCVLPYGTYNLEAGECAKLRSKYYGDYDLTIKVNTSTPVPIATLKTFVYCSVEKKSMPAYCEGGYDLNDPSISQICSADPYYYACPSGMTPSIQSLSQNGTCVCN